MAIATGETLKKRIDDAAKIVKSQRKIKGPISILNDANQDDLLSYSAAQLADIVEYATHDVLAFKGTRARVTIKTPKDFQIDGQEMSILMVTSLNRPFLYDSIMGEVTSGGRLIKLALHPILVKGDDGAILTRDDKQKLRSNAQISHIQIHLPRLSDDDAKELIKKINHILEQISCAVKDWRPMLDKLSQTISDMEQKLGHSPQNRESVAFLKWLYSNNFTFLGMREYAFSERGGQAKITYDGKNGLGILSDPDLEILRVDGKSVVSTPEIIKFLTGKQALIVTKANMRSVVHRRTYMDYIGVKQFDAHGKVIGELRIVGLFTSSAYTKSVTDIPLLRAKIDKITKKFGYDPDSHSGKNLLNVLESYPRDDLFQIDPKLLYDFCVQMGDLEDRPRVKVLTRVDQFDRFVSVIVYVPRVQYNSNAREKIGDYLKFIYGDRVSAFYPSFPSERLARVHFIIGRTSGKTPKTDQKLIEQDIIKIVTRWEDHFRSLAGNQAQSISVNQAFMEHFSPQETYNDLSYLTKAAETAGLSHADELQVTFLTREDHLKSQLAVKIFNANSPLSLSLRVPLLENLGFRVVSEQTHQIEVRAPSKALETVIIHDMELELPPNTDIDLSLDQERLVDAFKSIWRGDVDNDAFNRLVTIARLNIREAKLLRALSRYLRQAGITFSQRYMADCLVKYPDIAQQLIALFTARFNPEINEKDRTKRQNKATDMISKRLDDVPSLDDDKIIRRFMNVILSTLRSNYYQRDEAHNAYAILAFKLDPNSLDELPEPVPYREIFIYGPEVEGVHLRFGPVARGGLRWSDRAEDYRTEVLGLVKAQQVKNAVIVPVGSKGGFYPKKLPQNGDRDAIFRKGRDAYKLFIGTMLSITDNLNGAKVVPPKNTVRHDGDDPYFVVAADKGTATFSDTANAISQEMGFWLDDAFASGGSAGYDHKKMGITAKGAWEAVKRHFREMNIDIQKEPFTVAGVGDMSGDVFGNGMLLSKKIRLRAAFDHRDIFIDPDPDCDVSYQERQRLFKLDRSSWQSYDQSLLSKGGMIISRSEKSITLTQEAADMLQMDNRTATPHEILKAILKAPNDLLWFGGIGTYIRDESENDADVGDRANDPIRVTAKEVGAKVIGEGANLGITQRARIAFALRGGRCNSDAIDNSAGVNSSDVEVNIKIALANAIREKRLDLKSRNKLLAAMTNNVSKLVLRNNYLQTLAISSIERQGISKVGELGRLMNNLELRGLLNRSVETLPDEQTVLERIEKGLALSRPEIGVLLSYAKLVLFNEVIESDLPDDPYLEDCLISYFPDKMLAAHDHDMKTHRLRREIIATLIVNDAINRGGPSFINQFQEKSGASSDMIVKSYILARDGLAFNALYDAIDALDNKVDGDAQTDIYGYVNQSLMKTVGWALKTGAMMGDLKSSTQQMQEACEHLASKIEPFLPPHIVSNIEDMAQKLLDLNVPRKLARQIANLRTRVLLPEIMQISLECQADQLHAAKTFFEVTQLLHIGKIQSAAEQITTSDHYELLAISRALDEMSQARRTITSNALTNFANQTSPASAWAEQNQTRMSQAVMQLQDILASGEITAAKLALAAGMIVDLSRN